jgi:hypothetical protein
MDDPLLNQRVPADHYRRRAAEARRLAGDATTPAVKQHCAIWRRGSSVSPKASMRSLLGNRRDEHRRPRRQLAPVAGVPLQLFGVLAFPPRLSGPPIHFRASDPSTHAAAAREFRTTGFPADRAPTVEQNPSGSGFRAGARACACSVRDGLPILAHSQDRPAHSRPARPAIGPRRPGGR